MSDKEKLDLAVKNAKKRLQGLSIEDAMRIKWALLAAQGSTQSRKLKLEKRY